MQLFGHFIIWIELQSLVEIVQGLLIITWAILLRIHHNHSRIVETMEHSKIGLVGSFLWLHGFYLTHHALSLLKVLLCFAVLRMGADIAEQEHSLLIFRTDAVGLHGLQTLQGSELLSHGRLSLLGMTTEEDEHKGC